MELFKMAPSLLLLICGDVEPNPGPCQETPARSEVIRKFTRCIQSDLVKLIYEASNEKLPTPLYDTDPPGWNLFETDIKFENICNVQKGGTQIFDKLLRLIDKKVRKIPTHIADVINCYRSLSNPKMRKKTAEAEKLKETLENYTTKSKVMKHSDEMLKTMGESFLIDVLRRSAELARQGSLSSSEDGLNNILDAINDLIYAVEQTTEEKLPTGKKRCLSIENQEVAYKIKQMKKRKVLSSCRYAGKGKVMSKGKSKGGKKSGKMVAQVLENKEINGSGKLSTITDNNDVEQNSSSWGFQVDMYQTHEFYTKSQLESPPHTQGVLDDLFPDSVLLPNPSQNEASPDYLINTPVTKEFFSTPEELPPVDTSIFNITTIDATRNCDAFSQEVDSTLLPSIIEPLLSQSQSTITDQFQEHNSLLYGLDEQNSPLCVLDENNSPFYVLDEHNSPLCGQDEENSALCELDDIVSSLGLDTDFSALGDIQ